MNDDDRRDRPDPELGPLLDALPREQAAPPDLEPRVIRSIHLMDRRRRLRAIVAAAVMFALGLGAGRLLTPSPEAHATGGFLLLLYEDGGYRPAAPGMEAARVEEYRSWARELEARGIRINGERLADAGVMLEERSGTVVRREGADRLGGFFLVRVATREEAERIAATCPHLRHGGRVAVKAVLPT